MNAEILASIRAKIAERKASLEEIQAEIEHLEASLAIFERDQPKATRTGGNSKTLRNAIYGVLKDEGDWMHRNDIYDELVRRGVDVPGKAPVRNVGAHLSADDRFTDSGNRDGLWRLKSQGRYGASSTTDQVEQTPAEPEDSDKLYQSNGHSRPMALALS